LHKTPSENPDKQQALSSSPLCCSSLFVVSDRRRPTPALLLPPPSPHAATPFLSSHRASASSSSRVSPPLPSSHASYSYSSSSKRDLPLRRPDKQRRCLRDSSWTKLRSSCSPAPSKDSVESVLQALLLHQPPHRAVVRDILQISTARETITGSCFLAQRRCRFNLKGQVCIPVPTCLSLDHVILSEIRSFVS
jgi:hypothetical protein